MAKTLIGVVNDTLKRLGDTAQQVWTAEEVKSYLKEGYDDLALLTNCFWDQAYLEDQQTTANTTATWESAYLLGGWLLLGVFKFTSTWEQDYLTNPGDLIYGPTSHTAIWEGTSTYLSSDQFFYRTVHTLPENLNAIDRVTWNNWKIEPIRSSELDVADNLYRSQQGEVMGYVQDSDGLRSFRKWRIPSTAADEFTVTGNTGILRSPTDITGAAVTGTTGIPRRIPTMHATGNTGGTGLPRRCFQDIHNTRIEFSRRGRAMIHDSDVFELPDRYCKYLRHFATWKCLAREGPGQDAAYAEHWKGRWEMGIMRMVKRMRAIRSTERLALSDGTMTNRGRPPTARLPWQYTGPTLGYPPV